jgi:RNA polymerase sigma-70 factor (ECF subfamily)
MTAAAGPARPDPAADISSRAAFVRLAEPHRPAIRAHCYRMMGALHEAEDLTQETYLRAWRSRETFAADRPLRHWLHRIATNACLDALSRRSARRRVLEVGVAPAVGRPIGGPRPETAWLEPFPDRLLAGVPDPAPDPARRYELRESLRLAFVAAVQRLAPRPRAVLLLRDVLGWSADETAQVLGGSRASVNSALQRARAALAAESGPATVTPDAVADADLIRRYVTAWEARDMDGFVSLLRADAVYRMPPWPQWYDGVAAIRSFFDYAWGYPGDFALTPVRGAGQPGVAVYKADGPVLRANALQLLSVEQSGITAITAWVGPLAAQLFPAFGLPVTRLRAEA